MMLGYMEEVLHLQLGGWSGAGLGLGLTKIARERGVLVVRPGRLASLAHGDTILRVRGEEALDIPQVFGLLAHTYGRVEVVVLRGGGGPPPSYTAALGYGRAEG